VEVFVWNMLNTESDVGEREVSSGILRLAMLAKLILAKYNGNPSTERNFTQRHTV